MPLLQELKLWCGLGLVLGLYSVEYGFLGVEMAKNIIWLYCSSQNWCWIPFCLF